MGCPPQPEEYSVLTTIERRATEGCSLDANNVALKAALKTDFQSLQGWTKRLHETLQDLNGRTGDGRPSALKMLQTTFQAPVIG